MLQHPCALSPAIDAGKRLAPPMFSIGIFRITINSLDNEDRHRQIFSMGLVFEWDNQKADANQRKHQVSFAEVRTVFGDPFARMTEDQEHSEGERRGQIIGMSDRSRVLVVAYTERGERLRIITARKAEPHEKRRYEKIREKNAW